METRVQERERTIADLESRLQVLTGMLQKEQANRDFLTRRLSVMEAELSAARQVKVLAPIRTSRPKRPEPIVKVPERIKRPTMRKPASISKKRKQKNRRR